MSKQNPSFLREYKGYKFHDDGIVEGGSPEDYAVTISKDGKYVQLITFKNSDPTMLNKAIEKAKEWVDAQLKENSVGGGSNVERYSDEQLEEFKEILLSRKNDAQAELTRLQDLHDNPDGSATDISPEGGHDAKHFAQLIGRQNLFIRHLDDALSRIANKTYGICRVTGKLISGERLRAIPHATLSQEAKDSMNTGKTEQAPPAAEKKTRKKRETQKEPAEPVTEEKIRKCRVCGCTQDNCQQCIDKTGAPCHWIELDLCSACVEVPEIKVTDERAASGNTEDPPAEVINVSGFFKQLASAGEIDLTLRMKSKEGKITVELIPAGRSLLKPILVTGTPEDLDHGFCSAIIPKFNEIAGLKHNLDEVKTHVKEKVDKKAEEKPAQKKRGPKPKKSGGSKVKSKPKQKPAPKVKSKPAKVKAEPKKRGPKPKVKVGPPELPGLTETIQPQPEAVESQEPIAETNS